MTIYLIIVNYFSRYIKVSKLEEASSKSVVTTQNLYWPNLDNGPQYTAEEYIRFTKECGIQHMVT